MNRNFAVQGSGKFPADIHLHLFYGFKEGQMEGGRKSVQIPRVYLGQMRTGHTFNLKKKKDYCPL